MRDRILLFLFIHCNLLSPVERFDWAWGERRVGEHELFEINYTLLRLETVNEAFLVNPSNRSIRGELLVSDGALDIKPRDVLGRRILVLMFRQNASSSAPLYCHTDLLSCLLVGVVLVDDRRPTACDSFASHLLLKGLVMTLGVVDSTAEAIVDTILPLTTGSVCKMLLLDLLAGVEAVLCLTEAFDQIAWTQQQFLSGSGPDTVASVAPSTNPA